jgi:hypothetical protein
MNVYAPRSKDSRRSSPGRLVRDVPQVDTDFPLPPLRWTRYNLQELKVGESKFLAGRTVNNAVQRDYWKKHFGIEFRMRTKRENGVLGVRVWRSK